MVLDGELHLVMRHAVFGDQDITLDGKLEDDGKIIKGRYVLDKHQGPDPEGTFTLIQSGPVEPLPSEAND